MMKSLHFVLIYLATKQNNFGVRLIMTSHVMWFMSDFHTKGFPSMSRVNKKDFGNNSGAFVQFKTFRGWKISRDGYNLAQPMAQLLNNRMICCWHLSSRVWNFYPRYGISSHLLLTFKPLSADNPRFTSIYMKYNLSCILYSVSLKLKCTRINIFHHFCSHWNIGFISLWQEEQFVGLFKIWKIVSFFHQFNFTILKKYMLQLVMLESAFYRPKSRRTVNNGRLTSDHGP